MYCITMNEGATFMMSAIVDSIDSRYTSDV